MYLRVRDLIGFCFKSGRYVGWRLIASIWGGIEKKLCCERACESIFYGTEFGNLLRQIWGGFMLQMELWLRTDLVANWEGLRTQFLWFDVECQNVCVERQNKWLWTELEPSKQPDTNLWWWDLDYGVKLRECSRQKHCVCNFKAQHAWLMPDSTYWTSQHLIIFHSTLEPYSDLWAGVRAWARPGQTQNCMMSLPVIFGEVMALAAL